MKIDYSQFKSFEDFVEYRRTLSKKIHQKYLSISSDRNKLEADLKDINANERQQAIECWEKTDENFKQFSMLKNERNKMNKDIKCGMQNLFKQKNSTWLTVFLNALNSATDKNWKIEVLSSISKAGTNKQHYLCMVSKDFNGDFVANITNPDAIIYDKMDCELADFLEKEKEIKSTLSTALYKNDLVYRATPQSKRFVIFASEIENFVWSEFVKLQTNKELNKNEVNIELK